MINKFILWLASKLPYKYYCSLHRWLENRRSRKIAKSVKKELLNSGREEQHRYLYTKDGIGTDFIERKVKFCHPNIDIKVIRSPKNIDSDMTIVNLRQSFELAEKEYAFYENNYDEFMKWVKTFIAGEFTENGIYTNIKYEPWVHQNVIRSILMSN